MFRVSLRSKAKGGAGAASQRREQLILIAYDIRDRRRWRRVFRLLSDHGEWLQLSLFQCLLTPARRAALQRELASLLDESEDHALIVTLGPSETAAESIVSLGKDFVPIRRRWTVV